MNVIQGYLTTRFYGGRYLGPLGAETGRCRSYCGSLNRRRGRSYIVNMQGLIDRQLSCLQAAIEEFVGVGDKREASTNKRPKSKKHNKNVIMVLDGQIANSF